MKDQGFIRVELTDDQLKKLGSLFSRLFRDAYRGKAGAVVAQVFGDGMKCAYLSEAQAKRLGLRTDQKIDSAWK